MDIYIRSLGQMCYLFSMSFLSIKRISGSLASVLFVLFLPGITAYAEGAPSSARSTKEESQAIRSAKEYLFFKTELKLPKASREFKEAVLELVRDIDTLPSEKQKLLREKVISPLYKELSTSVSTSEQFPDIKELKEQFLKMLSVSLLHEITATLDKELKEEFEKIPLTLEAIATFEEQNTGERLEKRLERVLWNRLARLNQAEIHRIYLGIGPLVALEKEALHHRRDSSIPSRSPDVPRFDVPR